MGVICHMTDAPEGDESRMSETVRSMTGYGRAQDTVDGLAVTVELRSVNHRFFEYASRLPRGYAFLDPKLKALIQRRVGRGKLDVSVQIDRLTAGGCTVAADTVLADGYMQALRTLSDRYGIAEGVTAQQLAALPDVLTVRHEGLDEEAVWQAVQPVAEQAVAAFVAMRQIEGARLRDDVLARADTIEQAVEQIERRSPETVREHMEKMQARLHELLGAVPIDESRLLTEAAVYADKIAVAEETVRLRSHLAQLRQMVGGSDAVGRKLDFLVQEINREANTIGSKCSDLALTRLVVDMKNEIEKIREQIQNIE